MGRSSNLMIEMKEEELEENKKHSIAEEAAHYVINEHMSRKDALNRAKDLHEQRQDSDNYVVTNEENMEIEYLFSELKEPKFVRTPQIKAITEELYIKFE